MKQFIACLSLAISVMLVCPAASAADESDQLFLSLLNAERSAAGRTPLTMQPAMQELARSWAIELASTQQLQHRPTRNQVTWIEARVTPRWRQIAENVGYGSSVSSVHQALMASPKHRANALGDFSYVGIGSTRDDAGRIWVTFNFLEITQPDRSASVSTALPERVGAADRAIATIAQ